MNHKQYIHAWIRNYTDLGLVFDMTSGNGYDTLFLAGIAKHVVAIDIQKQAIAETKKRTSHMSNITYLNQSHSELDLDTYPVIDGAIYNLGYLPGSDKSITTQAVSTVASLKEITPLLKRFLVVSCYRSHDGGNEEYLAVKSYTDTLYAHVEVFEYPTPNSPVSFLIDLTK